MWPGSVQVYTQSPLQSTGVTGAANAASSYHSRFLLPLSLSFTPMHASIHTHMHPKYNIHSNSCFLGIILSVTPAKYVCIYIYFSPLACMTRAEGREGKTKRCGAVQFSGCSWSLCRAAGCAYLLLWSVEHEKLKTS